jgi:putative MFS transporter
LKGTIAAPVARRPVRRFGQFHWLITLLVSLAFGGNGVTLSAISFALPGMRQEWGLSSADLGLMTATVSTGQVVGALVIGWLADRLGRRYAFPLTIAFSSVAAATAALAPNATVVTALFLLAGIGFGGVAPVATSLLGEFAPPMIRGQLMTWTQIFWAAGWCLAGLGGTLLVGSLGWRPILLIGAAPAVLAVLAWRMTPESPRFLLAMGRRAEAEALVREIEEKHGVRLPLPEQQLARKNANPWRNLRELLGPTFRRRSLMLWATWLIMLASFNGPIILLPSMLTAAGASEELAARTSLIAALFMLPTLVLSLFVIDRVGRRPLMVASLLIAMLGSFGLALLGSPIWIVLSSGALAAGVLGAWPTILGYSAELYPTRLRATAAGWAGAVSRLGGVGAPLIIGALLQSSGGDRRLPMLIIAALLLVAALLVAISGEETRGRTLEELSG